MLSSILRLSRLLHLIVLCPDLYTYVVSAKGNQPAAHCGNKNGGSWKRHRPETLSAVLEKGSFVNEPQYP